MLTFSTLCAFLAVGAVARVEPPPTPGPPKGPLGPPKSQWKVGQPVRTSSGLLFGHPSAWKSEVSEYLGVRYAQAPVNNLRWAPPREYISPRAVNASAFSVQCPGNVRNNGSISYASVQATVKTTLGQFGGVFGEDCLTVNVWAKPQVGERRKAVMVWVYGGGFNSGNTDNPSYNGARLADEKDVVVVSLNYRVHVFGFPGATYLEDKNLGLLDQRMALEWVRDNVEEFGGDPRRITLFGQSAGGVSVDLHTYAWARNPIAQAFIPSSGSYSNRSAGVPGAAWFRSTEQLGCGGQNATSREQLKCMRSKSFEDILKVTAVGSRTGNFGPTPDGRTVFADFEKRRAEGRFAQKPMLIGNTNDEGALYEMLGIPSSFNSTPGIYCLSHTNALARKNASVPVWRYEYAGEWPNMDIGYGGAWHGSDIPMWFGTAEYANRVPDTAEEKKFIDFMMDAWSGFAKDPERGLLKLKWPQYDPAKPSIASLGARNSSAVTYKEHKVIDDC